MFEHALGGKASSRERSRRRGGGGAVSVCGPERSDRPQEILGAKNENLRRLLRPHTLSFGLSARRVLQALSRLHLALRRLPPSFSSSPSPRCSLSLRLARNLAPRTHLACLSNRLLARLHGENKPLLFFGQTFSFAARSSRTTNRFSFPSSLLLSAVPRKLRPRRRLQYFTDQQGAEPVPPAEADPR